MAAQATRMIGKGRSRITRFSIIAKKFHQEVTKTDRTRQLRYHLTQITNKCFGSMKYKIIFKK